MRFSKSLTTSILPLLALAAATTLAPAFADSGDENSKQSGAIYNSVLTPLPGNLPSQPFEAQAVSEFGNEVNFASGTTHALTRVIITMSSWGCASGSWYQHTCTTPEDASFSVPITLNVYGASNDGVHPGTKIVSVTKSFEIKYRPSASAECTGPDLGKWYDEESKTCFNGLAQNISFNLKNVKVGSSAVIGIAYNTTHYGYAPIGQSAPCFSTPQGCGYDSLNVALTQDPIDVSIGSSVVPGKLWIASTSASTYADNGAAGLGAFRIDSPNVAPWWGTNGPNYDSAPWYVPSMKIFASDSSDSQAKAQDAKPTEHANDSRKGIKND